MRAIVPCKGCPDRTAGERTTDCHTTCERYAAYKAAKAAENNARRDYVQLHSAMMEGRVRVKETPPFRKIRQTGGG